MEFSGEYIINEGGLEQVEENEVEEEPVLRERDPRREKGGLFGRVAKGNAGGKGNSGGNKGK